jgi:hypothetical protein
MYMDNIKMDHAEMVLGGIGLVWLWIGSNVKLF